jgi:RND family efflux transporter MFP subunit
MYKTLSTYRLPQSLQQIVVLVAALGMASIMSGCKPSTAAPRATPPVEVTVVEPSVREITDHEDFTGQTEAYRSIDIRARVTGYLDRVNFREGAEVEEGKVLFEIDARPYEAEVARAEAAVQQAKARLTHLEADLKRAEALYAKATITAEQYERVLADRNDAKASLQAAQATLELNRLNVEFTKVTAPIRGRISRQFIDPGNLVKGDETVLTRLVSQDPIYVYFDINERTMLRVWRLQHSSSSSATKMPVLIGLSDESGFPHRGTIDFEENRVDPGTGTLRVRGVFSNEDRMLSPGLFARVRVPIGEAYQAILVPEQAVGTDQGQKFVYVVDDQNQVVYRPIRAGGLHDGFRVVEEGLERHERVVVSGLQRIRAGASVEARLESPEGPASGDANSKQPAS